MGRPKMLLPIGGKPMLAHVIDSLQASDAVSHIVVVTGHAEQEIRAVADEYTGVTFAHNAGYEAGGMLSSVKTGVTALPADCDAFFLVLGDQPLVQPATVSALAAAWIVERAPIVLPVHIGKCGHPVLISASLSPEILALGEDETLKALMVRRPEDILEVAVPDVAVVEDVDTPDDYEMALDDWRRRGS
jgi:CTP:molybdopterin cytidylyltransferase MocA